MSVAEELGKKYKFKLEDNDKNKRIKYLSFEDGKKYKLQYPSFMEMHEIIHDHPNSQTAMFELGMKRLFPENSDSPNIDEDYCEANQKEARMWSEIIRGLLSGYYLGE